MAADVKITFNAREARKFFSSISENTKKQKKIAREYARTIAPIVVTDILNHFNKEKGPDGPWAKWSRAYSDHMARIGKGGNRILVDSGKLRKGVDVKNWRAAGKGIVFFNPAKTRSGFDYSGHHNTTARTTRPFMWFSERALDKIAFATLEFMFRGA